MPDLNAFDRGAPDGARVCASHQPGRWHARPRSEEARTCASRNGASPRRAPCLQRAEAQRLIRPGVRAWHLEVWLHRTTVWRAAPPARAVTHDAARGERRHRWRPSPRACTVRNLPHARVYTRLHKLAPIIAGGRWRPCQLFFKRAFSALSSTRGGAWSGFPAERQIGLSSLGHPS
jgi:hypothetical protein